jgi:branched-subunit amino acid transport protein
VAGAAAVSEAARIWTAILAIGLGTFLIRYSFIGVVGDRRLPGWTTRLLRYVPMVKIAISKPCISCLFFITMATINFKKR